VSRLRPAALLAALLALALLAGCTATGPASSEPIGERAVRVTTTTNFITDTVARIGGDRVELTGLMGPGVDPHLYRASADDVRVLRESDVIFYGGLNLEGRMSELLSELGEQRPTRAVTDDIPREELLAPPAGAVGEEYDPHVWFDVSLWMQASRTIADTLIEVDPQHRGVYEANLATWLAELTELDEEIAATIATIAPQRRLLVTSHDAFAYLGRRYGLEVAGIQGISTQAEATTADIERIADLLARRRLPAVFVETSVPRQTIDALVAAAAQRGSTVQVGEELYTDAAGSPGTPEGTYVGMLRANAERIVEGLAGPEQGG
jgi:manganese/zinc/iron transport system substrate-binding protein